ncbi:MAG TPA: DUF302 domain-containing protein [Candidatus Limnocylindria bacterium]|nr:DUF302 domain-containing protein [Candidatus Limnocylindria bacterium]
MNTLARTPHSFGRTLATPYAQAVDEVKEALKGEGFGILSEIDVKAVLKEKRGVDFRRYVILGACNPPLAEKAFAADLDVGLLLPCNVVVYEDDGGSRVEVADPIAMLEILGRPELRPIADEAKAKLERAVSGLGDGRR